jgi:signal transduction histidine kinase
MRRRLPAGLRWRFLLALVATSAVTLGVTALVVLPPLQHRLRDQNADSLLSATRAARADFAEAMRAKLDRTLRLSVAARPLIEQADSRVLVANNSLTFVDADGNVKSQAFIFDSEVASSTAQPARTAYGALLGREVVHEDGDAVTVAMPLWKGADVNGVLVTERRLSEVSALVDQVRNRFLIAAVVGLSIAALLAIALSSTLLRRLARLRGAALRITDEGPEATMPHDERRDEVGDLARALARMQEELRRQEAARRAFVSTASHELRTPLTMLQGTMELLEEDIRSGQIDELDALRQVNTARRELDRLSALSGELLDLSRLDAAVPLRSEPVELGEIVRAVAAEFELRARERSTTVDVILPEASCWGRGDPDAVARVVRILLDNALRYGPRGAPISVEAHSGGGEARITVADQGAGIPADERDRIFERFHRGGAAASSGGFGLGLAIGRELAQRMGGELGVDGDGSDGTRFALTLRTARSPADPPRGERDRVSA